jgi:DNA-binding transcriptional MerR regulator
MQIKDVAQLTGTTVRTIRYYHQIGLLTVPPVRHGRRDYDVSHLARVGRIRWLAETGLSLAQVGAALSVPRDAGGSDLFATVLADLRATVDILGERIDSLAAQRGRLIALVTTMEGSQSLSPMPPGVTEFYEALDRAAPDEATRAGVRGERDFLELAYLRGEVPPEAELLFAALDDQVRAADLEAFRESMNDELSDADVDRMATANVARILDRLGSGGADAARTVDVGALRKLYDLFLATGDEHARRFGTAMLTKLVASIEEAKQR